MERLTTDNPNTNLQSILNLFYVKDHETYVRGGGPAPDFEDISLNDFARRIAEKYHLDIPESDEDLPDTMLWDLIEGIDTMDGLLALIYNAGWAFAEIRHRLSKYEDTGLTPDEVVKMQGEIKTAYDEHGEAYLFGATGSEAKHIVDLLAAEANGQLFFAPCALGSTVYGHDYKKVTEYKVEQVSFIKGKWYLKCKNENSDFWANETHFDDFIFLTYQKAAADLAAKKKED